MRITGGTKTISLDWGQNGGYGSLKVTGDGTYGYLAFIADNPTFANQINVGDTIVITQGGNPYASANVISTYDTFSDAVVADPTLDWNGIKGIKLDNSFGITGFSAATNIDGFVVTQRKGLRITGGLNLGGAPIIGGLFTPTVTPTQFFNGDADFEMGVWNPFIDPTLVPDLSGNNHSMGLNDSNSGDARYYHFLNNSAQANDWNWPTADTSTLAIMGWFAFAGNLSGNVSLISRNEGGNGWALRLDGSGSAINLVKYNDADQTQAISPLSTNQWHFIGVAQSGDYLEFVIDGVVYALTGSANPFVSSEGPVRLQYDPYNGGNQDTEMWMRDVKVISSTAFTSSALLAVWNAQKAGYGY